MTLSCCFPLMVPSFIRARHLIVGFSFGLYSTTHQMFDIKSSTFSLLGPFRDPTSRNIVIHSSLLLFIILRLSKLKVFASGMRSRTASSHHFLFLHWRRLMDLV